MSIASCHRCTRSSVSWSWSEVDRPAGSARSAVAQAVPAASAAHRANPTRPSSRRGRRATHRQQRDRRPGQAAGHRARAEGGGHDGEREQGAADAHRRGRAGPGRAAGRADGERGVRDEQPRGPRRAGLPECGVASTSPRPTTAAAAGATTGNSAPTIRPPAYPAATARMASSTPSGRAGRPAAHSSAQAAHEPRITTPARLDRWRVVRTGDTAEETIPSTPESKRAPRGGTNTACGQGLWFTVAGVGDIVDILRRNDAAPVCAPAHQGRRASPTGAACAVPPARTGPAPRGRGRVTPRPGGPAEGIRSAHGYP